MENKKNQEAYKQDGAWEPLWVMRPQKAPLTPSVGNARQSQHQWAKSDGP